MKALITGSKGFVGKYLTKELQSQGWKVYGFNQRDKENLLDYEALRNKLDVTRPHAIFHLAAQAYVPESIANPVRAVEVNTIGSINLLEAVKQLGLKTKIHLAGTSEEYGDSQHGEGTITEQTLPTPRSPYAISKLAMDQMGLLYARSYGMHVVVTRAFNHTGAGRGEMYAESSFAKQVAEIEAGHRKVLKHGNLKAIRNYTHVKDIVRAYRLAIDLPSDVYNICSNNNVSMDQILSTLIDKASCEIITESDPSLYRPSDFSFKTPSCSKLTNLVSWAPEVTLEETLEDLLNYWRKRL